MVRTFSDGYYADLQAVAEHHASSKTYSGKFLRPHAPFIKQLAEEVNARSALDYGCGKGQQYEWVSHGDDASIPEGLTLEQYWGFKVHKYDPAWPAFADEPVGKYSIVICSHVLGSIRTMDLPGVVDRLHELCFGGLYVAEKLGAVGKKVLRDDPSLYPRGWTFEQWAQALRRVDNPIRVVLACRSVSATGEAVVRRERIQ